MQAEEFLLDSYKFIDVKYHDNLTVKIVIRMFMDFNLVSRFNIPYQVSAISIIITIYLLYKLQFKNRDKF